MIIIFLPKLNAEIFVHVVVVMSNFDFTMYYWSDFYRLRYLLGHIRAFSVKVNIERVHEHLDSDLYRVTMVPEFRKYSIGMNIVADMCCGS